MPPPVGSLVNSDSPSFFLPQNALTPTIPKPKQSSRQSWRRCPLLFQWVNGTLAQRQAQAGFWWRRRGSVARVALRLWGSADPWILWPLLVKNPFTCVPKKTWPGPGQASVKVKLPTESIHPALEPSELESKKEAGELLSGASEMRSRQRQDSTATAYFSKAAEQQRRRQQLQRQLWRLCESCQSVSARGRWRKSQSGPL